MKIVISDSSTLILLVKADIINELLDLVTIIIPKTVQLEIEEGKRKEKPDAFVIEKLIEKQLILIKEPNENTVLLLKKSITLDKGELYAIALAKDMNIDILIDDKKGIKVCKIINLKYFTAIIILLELCNIKKIDKDKSIKSLELLNKFGWYTVAEIKMAKKIIEENI
jgi:predicted nucleic acid-binding protein